MFSRFLTSALFAGAVTGLIACLLQLAFVQPALLHAELYESGNLLHFGADPVLSNPVLPGFSVVRDGLSVIFTMLIYTGYAMLLLALMSLAEDRGATIDGRTGLFWGVAGFVTFHLAPGFTLAPEVPGAAAADVGARQIWWFATVAAAGLALWLIAFTHSWLLWAVSGVLLAAPHLIGAPEPVSFSGSVPPELAALFAARALGVGMAAWVLLGSLTGFFWQRDALYE